MKSLLNVLLIACLFLVSCSSPTLPSTTFKIRTPLTDCVLAPSQKMTIWLEVSDLSPNALILWTVSQGTITPIPNSVKADLIAPQQPGDIVISASAELNWTSQVVQTKLICSVISSGTAISPQHTPTFYPSSSPTSTPVPKLLTMTPTLDIVLQKTNEAVIMSRTPTVDYKSQLSTSANIYYPGSIIPVHIFYPSTPAEENFKEVWIEENLGSISEYFDDVLEIKAFVTGMDSPPAVTATFSYKSGTIVTTPSVNLPVGAQLHLNYKVHLLPNIPQKYLPVMWQSGGRLGDTGNCNTPKDFLEIHTTTYIYLNWYGSETKVSTSCICEAILPAR